MSNTENKTVSADRAAIVAKLTSRKFWAAVVGFVTAILTAANVPASSAAQITAIIMAGATVIAYIVGEGIVDASAASGSSTYDAAVSADSMAVATDGKQTQVNKLPAETITTPTEIISVPAATTTTDKSTN